MRQRFLTGVAATLRFFPSESALSGAPTAATVTIKTASGADLATPVSAATATVDSVSTTLSAATSAGDRYVTLTSVSGVTPGKKYLVKAANGEQLLVQCAYLNSSTKQVYMAAPIPRDLASSDTFKGVEISYTIPAPSVTVPGSTGSVSDTGPAPIDAHLFRASWSYTVGGVDYSADQVFEINLRLLKPTLDPEELVPYLPDEWSHLTSPNDSSQMPAAISAAWERVLDDLAFRGFKPDKVMDPDRLRAPHLFQSLVTLGLGWGSEWKDWTTEMDRRYQETLTGALSAGDWYDADGSATQDENEVRYTSVILTR